MCWVLSKLYDFCISKQYCDVTLVSEDGKRYVAHRLILLATSSYFKTVFQTPLTEEGQNEFKIPGIQGDTLDQVLTFCYDRPININDDSVDAVLAAASFSQIPELLERCSKYYELSLRPWNCLGIWKIAEQYELADLKKIASDFTLRHFKEVVKGGEFVHVSGNHLEEILQRNYLNVDDEANAFMALLNWTNFQFSTRYGIHVTLFKHIRLPHIKHATDKERIISTWKGDPSLLNISHQRLTKRTSISTKLYAFSSFFFGLSIHEFDVGLCQWKDITPPKPARKRSIKLEEPQEILAYDVETLILIGGDSLRDDDEHKRVQSFNTKSGEIRELAPMLSSREGFSAALFGKEIYVFGGADKELDEMSTAEKYNLESNEWVELAPMHTARSDHASITVSKRILVMGGIGEKSVECYNPAKNKWFRRAPMLHSRSGFDAGTVNGFVYILGRNFSGWITIEVMLSIERYCFKSNKWELLNFSLEPAAMKGLRARIYDNWVYLSGYGKDRETSVFRKINLYDGEIVRLDNIKARIEFLV